MSLREKIFEKSDEDKDYLSILASLCEYGFFIGLSGVILTVVSMGLVFAITGSITALMAIVNVTIGIFVSAIGLLALSLLIYWYQNTYTEVPEPEDEEPVENEPKQQVRQRV